MRLNALLPLSGLVGTALAACPFADPSAQFARRAEGGEVDARERLKEVEVDDAGQYMTTDFGGNVGEQFSLKAGNRGSTLLEDFIFRQKLQHFDHERVCVPLLLQPN